MSKKKNIALKVIAILVILFALTICAVPYIPLEEGTFISAVLKGLYQFCIHHFGFFASDELQFITLLPFALFFVLFLVDIILNLSFVYFIFEATFFAGLYIICAYVQNAPQYFKSIALLPAKNWQYIGFELAGISFVVLVLLSIKEIKNSKPSKSESKENVQPETPALSIDDKTQKQPQQLEKNINPNMTVQEALAALTSVTVPDFKLIPNFTTDSSLGYVKTEEYDSTSEEVVSSVNPSIYAIASLDGDLHRQALSEEGKQDLETFKEISSLSKKFSLNNLREKIKQDSDVSANFAGFEENIDLDIKQEEDEVETQSEPNVPEVHFVEQMQAVKPKSDEPIFDEGSEGEESPEEAAEKYKKLKEETQQEGSEKDAAFDYVSGVGGLKSSRDGNYVYDPSKYRYSFPPESLLRHYETNAKKTTDVEHDVDGQTIVDTLAQFRIETQLVGVQHGPTFTLYELALARGIRVNTVLNLADNIAMDLAVPSVRILAPIPGKSAIGIEVPNKQRDTIGFDVMMPALKAKALKIPMVLGRTITGDSIVIDLAGAPHLLIAGTTGSGKSVCVNSLICSILFTKTPREVRMILVDPKMVELTVYNDIPHLLTPVITDAKKAIKAMAYIVEEMERRMSMFSMIGARKIEDYNQKIKEKNFLRAQLPYIVVIVDEFADLMMVVGKELESYIKRITAMARFTGIHLVLATQRPSADVITGIIKSNIPTQIAFAVSNQINSRIILDSVGAEKLLGKGDMLYASASSRIPSRIQGAYIDPEIEDIVKFVKTQGEPDYIDEAYFEDDEEQEEDESVSLSSAGGDSEDLYMKAWKIVADKGEASASYLQRRLSIGYNRAANLIEQLEENGCIGPARGSKAREILRYPDSRSEMPQV